MAIKGKKGFAYILLAVLFVGIFTTLFMILNEYNYEDKSSIVQARVKATNDFITDLHEDMQRVAFITGFRTLLGLEQYLSQNGFFFSDNQQLALAFQDVFINGSVNGSVIQIMENSTFNDYLVNVEQQAQKLDLLVNVTISDVTLAQQSPWILLVTITGDYNITDQKKSSSWFYQKNVTTQLPITNLKDPLYAVNTLGRVPNTIRNLSLPPDGFVNDTDNSTSTLITFIEGSYYHESSSAPSFLQRFTNNLSASSVGIESVVYLPQISDQGLPILSDRSVVDYIYFSSNPDNSSDRCSIDTLVFTPDWFRLDDAHAVTFEIQSFSYTPC